jgi:hypothetical protein
MVVPGYYWEIREISIGDQVLHEPDRNQKDWFFHKLMAEKDSQDKDYKARQH